MREIMAKIKEGQEKEFYYSESLEKERQTNRVCFVNGKPYSFIVRKGSKPGKEILSYYQDNYNDVTLVYSGKDYKQEVKINK